MPLSLRAKTLIVSSACALIVGGYSVKAWRDSHKRAQLEFFHSEAETLAITRARGSSLGRSLAPQHPEDWRYFLTPIVAGRIFLIKARGQIYDPWTYFRQRPNIVEKEPWPERADGQWMLRTNDLGFREDAALPVPRPALRVLVTGDSHTDGVCNNDESFANLLEARLRAHQIGRAHV